MSLSLPGNDLYWLSKDNLAPEEYERIISANAAWSRICREYEFDDGNNIGRYLINMREREQHISPDQLRSAGTREKEKLESRVFSGDVVLLSNMYGPARLFYINEEGQLRYNDPLAFGLNGVSRIVKEYNASVGRRDYQRTGGKPRPTKSPIKVRTSTPAPLNPKAFPPINSKAAGRLLAAGGVYNQNPEMFADTAKKLGGDAAKGFDQVLNEQTAGTMMAAAAIFAGGRRGSDINSLNKIKELQQINRKEKIGKWSLEELSDGAKYIDPASKKGDLTLAGRALQKHGSREGSAFPPVQGNPLTINVQGQNVVEGILNDPGKSVIQSNTGRYGQVTDIISSSGRGLRYDANGKLIGFLEPPR
ncbi:hypothetical protein [Yersinia similis]|uniref:hypothetical protein n=1 Tax=Yersinia similis TaxID=367190 RepID=UPI00061C6E58|nr:hypothetical protein [Yersinia similis]CNB12206.1 HNH endonuclease domain-containing protein [Yersinia similis]